MKILGESKKGHKILMVTEYEFKIIKEALFEWQYLQEQYICEKTGKVTSYHTDIKRINNRLDKALEKFEALTNAANHKELEEK